MRMILPRLRPTQLCTLVVLVIGLSACTEPLKHSQRIPDSVYVDLLVDLYLVDARHQEGLPPDTTLRSAILSAHNISEDQLASTTQYFVENRDAFEVIYDKVIDKLNEEQSRLRNP